MEAIIVAGVNGLRLNLSHGTQDQHAAVIKLARKLSAQHKKPVAIIVDLQGPKIRVGSLPGEGLPFVRGNTVRFKYGADYEKDGIVPLQYDVSKFLKSGERIFLRDGLIEVEVDSVDRHLITAKVLAPGLLFSNQGINLPDTDLEGEILTPKDIDDIRFATVNDADYIALSFVQTASDITNLREHVAKLKGNLKIIAKIETKAAVDNLDSIVEVADGLMVARGDLAIETKPEAVPAVQRRMIELGKQHRKPIIVATQMLESMITRLSPTRAEVSDVATAALEGSDAVMLSGETAIGKFPVESVKMMQRVISYTEREESSKHEDCHGAHQAEPERNNAISAAAVLLARQLPAKILIAETATGQTALNISSLRPSVPVIMVTNNSRVYQQLAIVWGGKSYLQSAPADATKHVIELLKAAGNVKAGDSLVIASGNQPGVTGGTNTVSIRVVQ
jgi:pyruvate kinase